jgi:predicted metal-dependent enzyme (double-stranded beta helix superfamily)
MDLRQYF